MAFKTMEPRTIKCPVCGESARETFFGVGFPGWLRLMDIIDDETKQNPVICPKCRLNLLSWLNGDMLMMPKKKK